MHRYGAHIAISIFAPYLVVYLFFTEHNFLVESKKIQKFKLFTGEGYLVIVYKNFMGCVDYAKIAKIKFLIIYFFTISLTVAQKTQKNILKYYI